MIDFIQVFEGDGKDHRYDHFKFGNGCIEKIENIKSDVGYNGNGYGVDSETTYFFDSKGILGNGCGFPLLSSGKVGPGLQDD